VLDPLVDKVLICGTYVMLAATPAVSETPVAIVAWMAVVVVVRELVVTGVRGEMERQGIDFSAGFTGKLKMIMQSVAIVADLIVRGGLTAELGDSVSSGVATFAVASAWIAIVLTIWSGLEYLWAARRVLTGGPAG
jgi:phosphatidylglycerophosphate synthase